MASVESTRPPGPSGFEVLKSLRYIQRDTLGYLMDCTQAYGDLVFFDVPGNPAFLVNRPDWIRHILQDNHRNYSKDTVQYRALSAITGSGLLTSDGDFWLRQRRLEQPAFARPRLERLDQVVVPAAQSMLERWQEAAGKQTPLDVDGEMMKVALEIVGKALFSIDLSGEAHDLTRAVVTVLDHIVRRARNPIALPEIFLTPRSMRFRLALSTLETTIYDLIAERRYSGRPGDDLLGMLLRARDAESGQPMSDEQIRDEVMTILIAGHETVAAALTWSWYLLAQHPEAWQQMRDEVLAQLGERPPTSADLPGLQFTGQVFDEALRLYPPAWLITRKAIAADALDAYRVPPGSLMIISPYVTQRHPRFWTDPGAFDPRRFSPATHGEEEKRPRFTYIPFGGGPRLCIGKDFALIEAKLILAMVTQRFRLELPPGQPVRADALVTIRPHGGLPMKLIVQNRT